jgi:hypothetical protein
MTFVFKILRHCLELGIHLTHPLKSSGPSSWEIITTNTFIKIKYKTSFFENWTVLNIKH